MFFPSPQLVSELNSNSLNFLDQKVKLEDTNQHSIYEKQYLKNFDLIKSKYKKQVCSFLSLDAVSKCVLFLQNYPQFDFSHSLAILENKIYCFLSALAFYEVDGTKIHDHFEQEDWEKFIESVRFLTREDVDFLKDEVFKKNATNYQWSEQEDEILLSLIRKSQTTKKIQWKQIVNKFNLHFPGPRTRSVANCRERWFNHLRVDFKKGKWTKEEDIKIFSYVLAYGTNWSKMTKIFEKRTEHNIKNRFFSVYSKHVHLSIRKSKKLFNNQDKQILQEILQKLIIKEEAGL